MMQDVSTKQLTSQLIYNC